MSRASPNTRFALPNRTPRRFRSRDWFDNPDHIDMTALYLERFMNYGITPEELRSGKPIIGIAQTGSDISPCNRIHLDLVTRVRDGIRDAGGIPMEFPVHPIFENCRRPPAVLEGRVDREFHRDAPGVADAIAHAPGQVEMNAIARIQVASGLRDPDDGSAGAQFRRRDAVVHEALEIERRHVDVIGVGEPVLRSEPASGAGAFGHAPCHPAST